MTSIFMSISPLCSLFMWDLLALAMVYVALQAESAHPAKHFELLHSIMLNLL